MIVPELIVGSHTPPHLQPRFKHYWKVRQAALVPQKSEGELIETPSIVGSADFCLWDQK